MNIKEIQINKALDEATLKYLRKGKFPTFSQVNSYVVSKFSSTIAGLPSFKPLLGKKYECSKPKEYNLMVDQINSDLTDLYDADNSCNNELLSAFSYYDAEKKKINSSLNKLNNRLDNLLQGTSYTQSKESIFDNFDDFSNIDFIGDEDRGISATTSFIDLLTKSVSNDTLTNDSKISLNEVTSKIEVADKVISNITLSEFDNCLKDSLNEVWLQQITVDSDTGVKLRFSIELPNETEITTIRYQNQSPRSISIKLSTINANKEVRTYKSVTTLDTAEWNIKRSKVKILSFEISKLEPDSLDGINYVYFIGARNISVYNDYHKNKSLLISKPFKISSEFNYAYLEVNQSLPPDTSIQYYLGMDMLDNQVHWTRLKNKKFNDIRLLDTIKINISDEFSTKFGDSYNNCFIMTELKHTPSDNTTNLYIGNNMWEKRESDIVDKSTFSLKDIILNGKLSYEKMDKINFPQKANTADIYTTYVYCESPTAIDTKVYDKNSSIDISVYVNSIKVELVDNKYTVRLSAGWNTVQILSLTSETDTLIIDAFFNDVADIVRAKKEPMKQTSIYNMLHNFHATTYDWFALDGKEIILNFNPKTIGMEGTVEYMYTDTPEDFNNLHVRFMAILESSSKDVTPKLLNYKIITK